MWVGYKGEWADIKCQNRNRFICEGSFGGAGIHFQYHKTSLQIYSLFNSLG